MIGRKNIMINTPIFRPTTRGDLAKHLKNGESCEVVEMDAEITILLLRGWIGVENFIIKKSPNTGWAIFEPISKN